MPEPGPPLHEPRRKADGGIIALHTWWVTNRRLPPITWLAHGSKGNRPSFAHTVDAFTGKTLRKSGEVIDIRAPTHGSTTGD